MDLSHKEENVPPPSTLRTLAHSSGSLARLMVLRSCDGPSPPLRAVTDTMRGRHVVAGRACRDLLLEEHLLLPTPLMLRTAAADAVAIRGELP